MTRVVNTDFAQINDALSGAIADFESANPADAIRNAVSLLEFAERQIDRELDTLIAASKNNSADPESISDRMDRLKQYRVRVARVAIALEGLFRRESKNQPSQIESFYQRIASVAGNDAMNAAGTPMKFEKGNEADAYENSRSIWDKLRGAGK